MDVLRILRSPERRVKLRVWHDEDDGWAHNPVQSGYTISHWDEIALPNQLMEPPINDDLTHSVAPPQDLTLKLLQDLGW